MSQRCRVRLTRLHKKPRSTCRRSWMDELTPICQMKDLPLGGSTMCRRESLELLQTSFVNTAIGNMKDNRILNNRPPSINDEETLLPRRQRTTLSQLRSGHCKVLNFYKKRPKQSDYSCCPDYGMDPQDVPHLFDCMTHPNDLSPANLWDKPIETIRELSFLDPGNLN